MRISEWLHEDPVSFDKIRREKNIKVNYDIFCILVSKLKANHPKYFIDALGLNARIKFKGYDGQVKAIVPYTDNPVEFYKWWCRNQDMINMTFSEKIKLFVKVLIIDQNALKAEHRHLINK